MNPVLRQFLTESAEGLERMTALLLDLERDPENTALVHDLFRVVHTLKGNSGLFDYVALTQMVHAGEDLLDEAREGVRTLDGEVIESLLAMVDVLTLMLDELDSQATPSQESDESARQLAQTLRALCCDEHVQSQANAGVSDEARFAQLPAELQTLLAQALQQAEKPCVAVCYEPEPECFFKGEDPLLLMRELPATTWLWCGPLQAWPDLAALDPYRCNLRFLAISHAPIAALRECFRCVPEQVALQAHAAGLPSIVNLPPAEASGLVSIVRAQLAVLEVADNPGLRQAAGRALRAVSLKLNRPWPFNEAEGELEAEALREQAEQLLAFLQPGAETPQTEPELAVPTAPGTAATAEPRAARQGGLLRVEQSKVDKLMELVGEMVVAKNALPYLVQKAERGLSARELAREIKQQHANINRITEELQDAVMQVRMLPVASVLQRFPRLVRDLSQKLDKQVRLELHGEETEADKGIVEALADPLIHVVRNSLDHGIEMPAERLAAGKPAEGCIQIRASQQAEGVVIEVSDDGAGIDPERIKAKAVLKGLLDPERAETLSAQQAVELVFLPGFSTAEQVSDLSGRGVGMDVVKNAIERLRGKVEIRSERGKGTQLRLTLPLSVAISHVMLIESGGQRFGIPMDCVVETVRLPAERVRYIKAQGTAVLRDRLVALHALNELLGIDLPPKPNQYDELAVLLIRLGNETVGLIVDDFESAIDLILKPFEGMLSSLRLYAGTALLGDGSVLMVLNPKELL